MLQRSLSFTPVKAFVSRHPLRSPTDRFAHSEFVFRACSSKSAGINEISGLIAGKYMHMPIGQVPTLDDIGTPGGRWSMTYREFEFFTLSHCNKGNPHPTPWISTSPSLAKVLPYALGDASRGVRDAKVFVIRILDCEDIYSAPAITEGLPTISPLVRPVWNNEIQTEGKVDEYLVFGKIPAHAIVGVLPLHRLSSSQRRSMDADGLKMMSAMMSAVDRPLSRKSLFNFDDPRELGRSYLRGAIQFVSAFDKIEDEYVFFWIVRILLGPDFGGPYRESRDGDRVKQVISSFFQNGRRISSIPREATGSGGGYAGQGMGYGGFNGPTFVDASRLTAEPHGIGPQTFRDTMKGVFSKKQTNILL